MYVRVRPLLPNEIARVGPNDYSVIEIENSTTIAVHSEERGKNIRCQYDYVFGPQALQSQIYDQLKECTTSVLEGFNRYINNRIDHMKVSFLLFM